MFVQKAKAALDDNGKRKRRAALYHQRMVSDNVLANHVLANHAALLKRDSEMLNA